MQQTSALEVGLPVVDLEVMLAFYSGVLGCVEQRRADIPPALSQSIGVSEGGYVNVWLATPNGEVIKLIAPPEAPRATAAPEFLSTRTGFAFLTFYCSDIDGVLARAEAAGAVLRSDRALTSGEIGTKLCFFADPEGNVIELVETLS